MEDFWLPHSDPTGDDGNGPRQNWCWTKVLKALKRRKKQVDKVDSQKSKIAYDSDEWNTEFSYRKGSKLVPLKAEAQIARRFRAIEGRPRFWDYVEEDEGEDADGESEA